MGGLPRLLILLDFKLQRLDLVLKNMDLRAQAVPLVVGRIQRVRLGLELLLQNLVFGLEMLIL